jgi:hypothetical protein
VTQDKRIPARTRIARRATGQDDLAMLKGKTKFKIIVSFPARLDRVHTYTAVIRISRAVKKAEKGSREVKASDGTVVLRSISGSGPLPAGISHNK